MKPLPLSTATLLAVTHPLWGPWVISDPDPDPAASGPVVEGDLPDRSALSIAGRDNASHTAVYDKVNASTRLAECQARLAERQVALGQSWLAFVFTWAEFVWFIASPCALLLTFLPRRLSRRCAQLGAGGGDSSASVEVELSGSQTDLTLEALQQLQDEAKAAKDYQRQLSEQAQELQKVRKKLTRTERDLEEAKKDVQVCESQHGYTRMQLQKVALEKTEYIKANEEQRNRIKDCLTVIKERNHKIDDKNSRMEAYEDELRQCRCKEQQQAKRVEELVAEIETLRGQPGTGEAKVHDTAESGDSDSETPVAPRGPRPVETEALRKSVLHRASQWEASSSQARLTPKAASPTVPLRPAPVLAPAPPAPPPPAWAAAKQQAVVHVPSTGQPGRTIAMPKLALEASQPARDPNEQMREKLRVKLERTESHIAAAPPQGGLPGVPARSVETSSPTNACTESVEALSDVGAGSASDAAKAASEAAATPTLLPQDPAAQEQETEASADKEALLPKPLATPRTPREVAEARAENFNICSDSDTDADDDANDSADEEDCFALPEPVVEPPGGDEPDEPMHAPRGARPDHDAALRAGTDPQQGPDEDDS